MHDFELRATNGGQGASVSPPFVPVESVQAPRDGEPGPMRQILDLATVARHSGYRVKGMASELGCSCRWLEFFCQKQFALTPHAWLARLRDEEIRQLARAGVPAKLISHLVGFADAASFCHSLKRSAGRTLRQLRELSQNGCSHKDNNAGSPRFIGPRQSILVRGMPSTIGTGTMRDSIEGNKITRLRRQAHLSHKGKERP